MIPYKELFGAAGVLVGLVGYVPYVRDLYRGTTKPHFFSWLVWTLLGGIAFLAQVAGGGGAGSWTLGVMTLFCGTITVVSFFAGEKNVTRLDWFCFVGALLGTLLWVETKDPTWAVVIVTIVDLVAFIPTFRKSYWRPHEETPAEFAFSSVKFIFAILALSTYSVATWLYPASLVLSNAVFAIMVYIRRAKLGNIRNA